MTEIQNPKQLAIDRIWNLVLVICYFPDEPVFTLRHNRLDQGVK